MKVNTIISRNFVIEQKTGEICAKHLLQARHQYLQFNHNQQDNYLDPEPIRTVCGQVVPIDLLEQQTKDLLDQHIPKGQNTVFEGKALVADGIRYGQGSMLLLSREGETYNFGKVISTFTIAGAGYVLCNKMRVVTFQRHFHSYVVEPVGLYVLVKPADLLDYHPLGLYNVGSSWYTPLRTYI